MYVATMTTQFLWMQTSEELWRRCEALVGEVQIEVVAGGRHVPGPQYHESKRKIAFLLGGQ